MNTATESLSDYYADFLAGQYDCVDRIILNAYFSFGCNAGGFRLWWGELFGNTDHLDNAHLMRMAGRFSRRVRGWGQKAGIPVLECAAGERKHDLAEQYLPKDPKQIGIFLVLVNRAPFPIWEVKHMGKGGLHLQRKKPMPYVNHYTFHIWDADWGHVAIRMCGHPPFTAMIMLNGHEYVAQRAPQEGVVFGKEDNCFTELADAPGLQKVADTLRQADAIGRFEQVCERWLYRCLCFALDSADQKRTGFKYDLSVYQMEYSRNFLFQRGRQMEQIFEGLIDRTRATLDFKTVKTILGKQRPKLKGKKPWEITVETPVYGLTVFRIHAGPITLKMYTKGERVLRSEVILHNARALRLGNSLPRWPKLVEHLQGILRRFLEVVHCADEASIDDGTWDDLPTASQVGKSRVAGIDMTKGRLGAVMAAVVVLSTKPGGFTSGALAGVVRERLPNLGETYQARQAAYDLKKLRGKNLVEKLGKGRCYQAPAAGLRTLVALGILRDKVFKPVLRQGSLRGGPCSGNNPVDQHYDNLRQEMRRLFRTLNIAA